VVIPLIRGLGGGDGDLKAWITLRRAEQSVFDPVIMVRAKGIPVDERLLSALPARPLGAGDAPAPADILRALALRGTVDTISRVLPRDDSDEIGFDVTLEFDGLAAL